MIGPVGAICFQYVLLVVHARVVHENGSVRPRAG